MGGSTASDTASMVMGFDSSDAFFVGGFLTNFVITTQVFRDTSAWYHFVVALDTTQGTATNTLKIYVNGSQITTFSTDNRATKTSSSVDLGINQAVEHRINVQTTGSFYGNHYLADIHFIDGQALTPTSFTETDATTGQLIPKAYTGSYTGNSFHLDFADNSSTTSGSNVGIGKDTSGLGNYWNSTNLSVTAGAGNDSLVDVPTNGSQTDTGVGGEVRGNYATLNPLVVTSTTTLANGNLDVTSSGQLNAVSTIVPSSGKWYLEITLGSIVTNSFIGLYGTTPLNSSYCVYGINGYGFLNTGWGSASSTVSGTGVAGDVIGLALDVDAKTLQYYKNGSSIGTISNFTFVQNWSIGISCNATVSSPWVFNFGQRPFAYQNPGTNRPSADYKALCTTNLPAPLVTKPNTVMDVSLWTGNGGTQSITLPGGFSPDFVWVKARSNAQDHYLFDVIRGGAGILRSNTTGAESTGTTYLSFDTSGFSSLNGLSSNGYTYAGWCWDAGSSTDPNNTAGSITSSVRANPTAGFSVVTYSGSSSGSTVGHGLGVAPAFIIGKSRNNSSEWSCYHQSLGNGQAIILNTTAAAGGTSTWNSTSPTSSVISLGAAYSVNYPGYTHVLYCFAPVVGYSSMGSYVGNGSSDGPFVYTGFRPRWVLLKLSSSSGGDWALYDTARGPYNLNTPKISPDSSAIEDDTTLWGGSPSSYGLDFLSNGFKLRNTAGGSHNGSGFTYIYAAFAESPFNYARAR